MFKFNLPNVALGIAIGALIVSNNSDSPSFPRFLSTVSHKTSLEDAAYKYGTDKSKDDHKYTDVYQMLFDNMEIKTLVEIGVAAGQSLQAWTTYLPDAQIYGFDPLTPDETFKAKVRAGLSPYPNVHFHTVNLIGSDVYPEQYGLYSEMVDVIIEDATHAFEQQKMLLKSLFRLVRPGGYYIIEDVAAFEKFRDTENLDPEVRAILQSNDCMLVDAAFGHRAWDQWLKLVGEQWVSDHYHHNSYMIVIRKRSEPLSPVKINFGRVAMQVDKVIDDSGH